MRKSMLCLVKFGFPLLLLSALAIHAARISAETLPLPINVSDAPRFPVRSSAGGRFPAIAVELAPLLEEGTDISYSEKRVDRHAALPGELLSYELFISNAGILTATVQVTDTLPRTPLVSFVPESLTVTQGEANWRPLANDGFGQVQWHGEVAPGASVRVNYQMRVSAAAQPGAEIINQVLFSDLTAGIIWYDQETVLIVAPDIADASKVVDKAEARAGDYITYELHAHNAGNLAAQVQLCDLLPHTTAVAFLDFTLAASRGVAHWDPAANDGFGAIAWQGELAPGEGITITFQMQVNPGISSGGLITNTALFTEAVAGRYFRSQATTRILAPDLRRSNKTVDKSRVRPGDTLSYLLIAANDGNAAAELQVQDLLPRVGGLALVSGSLTASMGEAVWDPAANDGYGAISWTGRLEPGHAVAIAYDLQVGQIPAGTWLINEASFVDAESGARVGDQATTQVIAPDLSASFKRVDKEAAWPGASLAYTIVANNRGEAPAHLLLHDDLPRVDGVTLLTDSLRASWGEVNYDPGGNEGFGRLTWEGVLDPNETLVISYSMQTRPDLAAGTRFTNTVTFLDSDTGLQWQATASTLLAFPDLSASYKSVNPIQAFPGEMLFYTIAMRNGGRVGGPIQMRDALPCTDAVSLLSDSLSCTLGQVQWRSEANDGYGELVWEGELDAGQAVTITYLLWISPTAQIGTVITDQVTFCDLLGGGLWSASASAVVVGADLTSSRKTVDKAVAQVGEVLTYALVAANTGNIADEVYIQDDLPRTFAVSFLDGSLQASRGQAFWRPTQNDGYGLVCWTGTLAPGQAVTITYQMAVTHLASPGTSVTNTVSFRDASIGREVRAQAETRLIETDLSASEKRVDKAAAHLGEMLNYTLLATNRGDQPTTVAITDMLPMTAAVQFVPDSLQASFGQAVFDPEANGGYGMITWRGEIAAEQTISITFRMQVVAVPSTRAVVTNSALFHDLHKDELYTRTASTRLLTSDLSTSTKLVDRAQAGFGDTLRYTLLGRNSGEYTTTLQIVDLLPNTPSVRMIVASLQASRGVVMWDPEANGGYGAITWQGELGAQELVTITYDMRVTQVTEAMTVTNRAEFYDLLTGRQYIVTAGTRLLRANIATSRKLVDKGVAYPGDILAYTLIGRNTGAYTSTLQIIDLLPRTDSVELITGSLSADWGSLRWDVTANDGYGALFWDGLVGPRQFVRISFLMRIKATGLHEATILNQALFRDMGSDALVSSSATTALLLPEISSSRKSADRHAAAAGEPVHFALRAANAGPVTATVQITDPLPHKDAIHWVVGSLTASAGQATFDPIGNDGYGLVSWVGDIGPGEAVTVTFALYADASAGPGEVITNTAIFLDHVGGQRVERSAAFVLLASDLSASVKAVNKVEARPGDVLTYTLVTYNAGNLATTAYITDILPQTPAARYVPGSLRSTGHLATFDPEANAGYGAVSWHGEIGPAQMVTVTFQVRVDRAAPAGEIITNQAVFRDVVRGQQWRRAVATMVLPPEARKTYLPLVSR